jgi:Peptidase A4 family
VVVGRASHLWHVVVEVACDTHAKIVTVKDAALPNRMPARVPVASLLVAALVIIFAVCSSTSGDGGRLQLDLAEPQYVFPITGFGGYGWSGKVSEVTAEWRVPRISSTSNAGAAATWIGAQNSQDTDFIQIGVNELALKNGLIEYLAFWSDFHVQFHPQYLGTVHPGELLFASMKHGEGGWTISLHNRSNSFSAKKTVSYGVGLDFTRAEWLQEDVAPGSLTSKDVPYPVMANVKFGHLQVNGEDPRLKLTDAVVLIASTGEIRVPTAVRGDSFTFKSPRGAQRQYLEDARYLDVGASEFQVEYANWPTTSTKARVVDVKNMISTLNSNTKIFAMQTWPKPARVPMAKLVRVTKLEIVDLQKWSKTDLGTGPAFSAYASTLPLHTKLVDMVRASLGLPPL